MRDHRDTVLLFASLSYLLSTLIIIGFPIESREHLIFFNALADISNDWFYVPEESGQINSVRSGRTGISAFAVFTAVT